MAPEAGEPEGENPERNAEPGQSGISVKTPDGDAREELPREDAVPEETGQEIPKAPEGESPANGARTGAEANGHSRQDRVSADMAAGREERPGNGQPGNRYPVGRFSNASGNFEETLQKKIDEQE